MPISFSASELVNLAIGIERRGIVFYDVMARSTENAEARQIFQYLVKMEREHIRIFQDMLNKIDQYQGSERQLQEHAAYLQALIDNAVFTEDAATNEMATQVNSDIGALELGISAEKDSILFYYEMREVMAKSVHARINKIIAEERSHLNQLSGLKKRLANVRSQDTEEIS